MTILPLLDDDAIVEYRGFQKDKRRSARTAGLHRDFLKNYRRRLETLRVVDPACGSGAFLIQALNRLMDEYRWIASEQERLEGQAELFDQDAILRSILSHNLYGVDINSESVEITKLALWLHTAAPGKPLCALDRNIRCGNSLVASDFYDTRQPDLFNEDQRERVNVFDWQEAFNDLLKLKTTRDDTLKTRILNLDQEIYDLDQVIAEKEAEMNEIVTELYGVGTALHQF